METYPGSERSSLQRASLLRFPLGHWAPSKLDIACTCTQAGYKRSITVVYPIQRSYNFNHPCQPQCVLLVCRCVNFTIHTLFSSPLIRVYQVSRLVVLKPIIDQRIWTTLPFTAGQYERPGVVYILYVPIGLCVAAALQYLRLHPWSINHRTVSPSYYNLYLGSQLATQLPKLSHVSQYSSRLVKQSPATVWTPP